SSEIFRKPSGLCEHVSDFVRPPGNATQVFGHVGIVTKIRPQRIPASQGLGYAVHGLLFLGLKRSEHLIPNDERTRVILINILRISSVMHAVVGGRVEDVLKPSELVDGLGVDPKLIQRVQCRNEYKVQGLIAEKRDGEVEPKSPHDLQRALPQGHREVVFFTLMVDHMTAPEEVNFMTHAVLPVISQVDQQEQAYPVPP